MRVALDVRPLQNASSGRGVGRYVRALIAHLPPRGAEYLYLESRWLRPGALPEGLPGRRLPLARPPRAITLFDQLATPLLCSRKEIDLFHSTFYALPRLGSRRARMVLTVHDLIPILIPGSTGPKNTAIFRQIYRSSRTADAVIVPSRRTASDLTERIGIPPERIRIIPMGVGAPFRPELPLFRSSSASAGNGGGRPVADPIARLRGDGAPILIYAGGFDATKNVPFLFDVMERLREERPVLCLVGDPGPARFELERAAARPGLEGRIVFLGRLGDEELAAAYASADLFVSSSLYEGFGLPALEAMACGCPVVALRSGAVPEVLDGAALAVEEKEAGQFAAAVLRVLGDEALRRGLIASGHVRASELSWERTGRETYLLYGELAGAR